MTELYLGLMSGTSLDGIDGVIADFSVIPQRTLGAAKRGFSAALRAELMSLQQATDDELNRAALAAKTLVDLYAETVGEVLSLAQVSPGSVEAIGCHGQTVRHRPDLGYTVQINNPARLAELTGITVVSDFRSRDIAAGGQGAPLVPAYHAALFPSDHCHRVIVNIGGIANITDLRPGGPVRGWDTGPGNVLLDTWCEFHLGTRYDEAGRWGATGQVLSELLPRLLAESYFSWPPPKSTGRDLFHLQWLGSRLSGKESAQDVQATLAALTAHTIADQIQRHCAGAKEIILCGGGALNGGVVGALTQLLKPATVLLSDAHGVPVHHVEGLAFAWLARQTMLGLHGNIPSVTGASGGRVLGAVYPK